MNLNNANDYINTGSYDNKSNSNITNSDTMAVISILL